MPMMGKTQAKRIVVGATQAHQRPYPLVIDVVVENHGTIFLFRAQTEKAWQWIDEHVQDDAQWWGSALVVEHRYAGGLAAGMVNDGLEVR